MKSKKVRNKGKVVITAKLKVTKEMSYICSFTALIVTMLLTLTTFIGNLKLPRRLM